MYLRTKHEHETPVLFAPAETPQAEPLWRFHSFDETWRLMLLEAADRIRKHGLWKPGTLTRGRYCALTAISPPGPYQHEPVSKFERYIGVSGSWAIPKWNDAPERTAADVIAALEGAARS